MSVKVVLEEIEVESARYLDNAQTEIFVLEPSGRTRVITQSQHKLAFDAMVAHKELKILSIEEQKAYVKAREEIEAKKQAEAQAARNEEIKKMAEAAEKQVAAEEAAAAKANVSPPSGASSPSTGDVSSGSAQGATPKVSEAAPVPQATSPNSTQS